MKHWLLKTEPSVFGIDDLARARARTTSWEGVRNYQARNLIRDQIGKGDQAFLYHSSCAVPGVAGIVKVVRGAYPDRSAFDKRDDHYDPASIADDPRWYTFDVQLVRRLNRVITLEELRKHADEELAGMILLRAGNRLSVTEVKDEHWRFILTLE
ncbi:MAG TPA: EVE domain-containing protein [Steroidobacteraceae bacterium]